MQFNRHVKSPAKQPGFRFKWLLLALIVVVGGLALLLLSKAWIVT